MLRSDQKLIPMVEGYKIFNEDLTCRGFQFRVGERIKLPNDDPLVLCGNGFHFCPQPSGVWAYYTQGRVFKIRAYGVLDTPFEPGSDFKMVCAEIELVKEISICGNRNMGGGNTGDRNTGHGNTGNRNTGSGNTGDRNTGDYNTGDCNTGGYNTGRRNTGHGNTGDYNTGDYNTGDYNTGDYNTGHGNTGHGNACDKHTGSLNTESPGFIMFDKKVNIPEQDIDWVLVSDLAKNLSFDRDFDCAPYLILPNATERAIKKLHKAHIDRRAKNAE